MKTLRSAMETATFGSVEVTVIRSVKEILNNVTELTTVGTQRNIVDRAIDVGGSGEDSSSKDEEKDIPDGSTPEIKDESNSSLAIPNKGNMSTTIK